MMGLLSTQQSGLITILKKMPQVSSFGFNQNEESQKEKSVGNETHATLVDHLMNHGLTAFV